jgi:CubicO group peptidase (beta-lactamase class C family)
MLAWPCLLLAACGAPAQAGGLSDARRAELDSRLEHIRIAAKIPGLAVGIVDGGQPIYTGTFGVRDQAGGAPLTPQTLFHLASVSKTFTVTAIMQLVEQHKLAISDPLEQYLPEFAGSGITIEELLTHSAGLRDWVQPSHSIDDSSVDRYVSRVAKHRRAYPPGRGWEYSDADFNLLGAVLEKVSGQTYPEYLGEHVFKPAGMTQTLAGIPGASADFAWPHLKKAHPHRAKQHPYDRAFVPSSGVESTITDMLRWAVVNLDRDPALLSPASFEAEFQPRVDTDWPGVVMGLGWQLEQTGDSWLPLHPGDDPGFKTLLVLYPAQRRATVILSNGEATPRSEIRQVVEDFLAGR